MTLTKTDEKTLAEFFANTFREVVLPALEDMEARLASKEDIDRLERKLDAHQDRMDGHGKQLENHEKRIQTLEAS